MNGISFPTNCSGGIYMSGNRRLLKVHDGGEGGTPAFLIRKPRKQGFSDRSIGVVCTNVVSGFLAVGCTNRQRIDVTWVGLHNGDSEHVC